MVLQLNTIFKLFDLHVRSFACGVSPMYVVCTMLTLEIRIEIGTFIRLINSIDGNKQIH